MTNAVLTSLMIPEIVETWQAAYMRAKDETSVSKNVMIVSFIHTTIVPVMMDSNPHFSSVSPQEGFGVNTQKNSKNSVSVRWSKRNYPAA